MNSPATPITTRRAVSYFGLSAVFAVAAAMAQVDTVGDTGIDNSGNYQQERGWCMVNTVGDERVSCLKASAAAQAEKRRGTLDNNGGNFSANAMRRCNVFSGEDRMACLARVSALGSNSGSVQGGGILRQVETISLPANQNSMIVVPKTP